MSQPPPLQWILQFGSTWNFGVRFGWFWRVGKNLNDLYYIRSLNYRLISLSMQLVSPNYRKKCKKVYQMDIYTRLGCINYKWPNILLNLPSSIWCSAPSMLGLVLCNLDLLSSVLFKTGNYCSNPFFWTGIKAQGWDIG